MADGPLLRLGYWLSSEEHGPNELVRNAVRAEEVGFELAGLSDHFHPWVPAQSNSPFVWAVLGGIAHATQELQVVTGVTAPIIRLHPAIAAHAAATAAVMFEGRFSLGVGTGERLNEHVTGAGWPSADERREMLEEAVGIMRELWEGGMVNHRGKHYTVDQAELFTRPETPPQVIVAGSSLKSARLAGAIGDGFMGVVSSPRHVEAFEGSGGRGKRRLAQVHVCWARTNDEALDTAYRWWPNAALKGAALTELARPKHFEEVLALARPEDIVDSVALGPDPEAYVEAITTFAKAGFNEIYLHQIGPDQEGFFRFYQREVRPQFGFAQR